MRSTTFARLALFLPYLILLESVLYFVVYDMGEKDNLLQSFNIAWNFLAIFWAIPYTLLVILLLVRSRGNSFEQIRKLFRSAPLLLTVIAPATYLVVLLIGSLINRGFFQEFWKVLLLAAAVSIPASLLLGYGFLGLSLLLHKVLVKIGFVREEVSQQTEVIPHSPIP